MFAGGTTNKSEEFSDDTMRVSTYRKTYYGTLFWTFSNFVHRRIIVARLIILTRIRDIFTIA